MLAPDGRCCTESVAAVLEILRKLGFLINEKKSVLEPAKEFTYLGLRWNTEDWTVGLKAGRPGQIRADAEAIRASSSVSVRQLARFLGRANATQVNKKIAMIEANKSNSRELYHWPGLG